MDTSTTSSSAMRSMLADEALAIALVPWACPCDFGPGGRYRLEELIAFGRRSFVYRARDSHWSSAGHDEVVAIKITPPVQGGHGASGSVGIENDALATRRVSHANVLRVIDRGEDPSGASYLVSEFVDGGTLTERQVPWTPQDAARFVATLARAVQAAHMAGVVHCDLKPSNILLTRGGEPKLADFDLSFSPINRDDSFRGNMAFMSPEQFNQEENALTPSADVYGLGGILYWLLSGSYPHGTTPDEIVAFHRTRKSVSRLVVETDLARICARALERQRVDRYGSALALAEDLEHWLELRPIAWTKPSVLKRSRLLIRRSPVWTVLALVALVAVFAGSYIGYDKTVGSRRRELETQRTINETTQKELDRVRQRLMTVIRLASAAINTGGQGGTERVLPALFWMEYLRGQIVLNAKGEVDLPEKRIDGLEKIVADADANGTAEQTDHLIARYALAGYLVDAGRASDALVHVAWMESHWIPKLEKQDLIVLGIDTLKRCSQAEIDVLTESQAGKAVSGLRTLREGLVKDGRSDSLVAIVDRTIKHISPPAPAPASVPGKEAGAGS